MQSMIYPLFGIISHDRSTFTVQYNDHFKDQQPFLNCSKEAKDPNVFLLDKEFFGIDFPIIDWSSTTDDEGLYFALYEHFETPHKHAAQRYLEKVKKCTNAEIITIQQAIQMFNLQTA